MRKSQGKITDSQNQTKYTNQTGKRHIVFISTLRFTRLQCALCSEPCPFVGCASDCDDCESSGGGKCNDCRTGFKVTSGNNGCEGEPLVTY